MDSWWRPPVELRVSQGFEGSYALDHEWAPRWPAENLSKLGKE
jgi:hypothetical protein